MISVMTILILPTVVLFSTSERSLLFSRPRVRVVRASRGGLGCGQSFALLCASCLQPKKKNSRRRHVLFERRLARGQNGYGIPAVDFLSASLLPSLMRGPSTPPAIELNVVAKWHYCQEKKRTAGGGRRFGWLCGKFSLIAACIANRGEEYNQKSDRERYPVNPVALHPSPFKR
jgi:hypothetical protein